MTNKHYILKGTTVVEVPMMEWAKWFETAKDERIVKQEFVLPGKSIPIKIGESFKVKLSEDEVKASGCRLSTVFLGIDHNFGDGPPILFETMVFGGKWEGEMDRYSTYDEALMGHERMKKRILAGEK